jgi:hypothetical protein
LDGRDFDTGFDFDDCFTRDIEGFTFGDNGFDDFLDFEDGFEEDFGFDGGFETVLGDGLGSDFKDFLETL